MVLRSAMLALVGLCAFGTRVRAEEGEDAREALRQELADRYRRVPSVHRAYVARVGPETQFTVEVFTDRQLWGARVWHEGEERIFGAATDQGMRMRGTDLRVGTYVPGAPAFNERIAAYRDALAALGQPLEKKLPDVVAGFGVTIGSEVETDAIHFSCAINVTTEGVPGWLDEKWWERFESWSRDAGAVSLRSRSDVVRLDDNGILLGAGGVTSQKKRVWTFETRPTEWSAETWAKEILAFLAQPGEPDRAFPAEFALGTAIGFAAHRFGAGDATPGVAAAIIGVAYPDDVLRRAARAFWDRMEAKVPELLDGPSNVKDGRRVLDERAVREIVREKTVEALVEHLGKRMDRALSVFTLKDDFVARVSAFRPALDRELLRRVTEAVAEAMSPKPR